MKVYVCGPISRSVAQGSRLLSMSEKIARFHEAEELLKSVNWDRQITVVNPVNVGNDKCVKIEGAEQPSCLRFGEEPNGQGGHAWRCYMAHDIEVLVHCDTIALLPGWQNSKGASLEQYIAQKLDMREIRIKEDNEGRLYIP